MRYVLLICYVENAAVSGAQRSRREAEFTSSRDQTQAQDVLVGS